LLTIMVSEKEIILLDTGSHDEMLGWILSILQFR